MRAFLFLLPLAASAAARPCDPVCDPKCDPKAKAKATATVVSCDPVQGAQTVRLSKPAARAVAGTTAVAVAPCDVTVSCDPISAPAVASTHVVGGSAVCAPSSGGLVAVGQGSACSPATVSAQGACGSVSTKPSVVTVTAQPGTMRLGSLATTSAPQGLRFAQAQERQARAAEELALDDETRESIREAIEQAREAQREAMEDAREAQREAAEEVREAMREAREAQAEAMREAELDVQEQLRAFQSADGQMFQDGQIQALTREALESAQKAMAGIDFEQFQGLPFTAFAVPAEAQGRSGGDGLEDRVRALERIAREQGHETTTDGSLEERVEALERALGARRSAEKRTTERALQGLYGLQGKQGQNAKVARPSKAPKPSKSSKGVRAYSMGEDGNLRELELPRSPMPAVPPVDPPDAPAPPAAPTPAAPGTWRFRSPMPSGGGTWMRTAPNTEERRDIEDQMKKLREEAEALRTEVQRMREKLESLPKHDERGAR